jgi:hypothetical protein
MKKGVIAIVFVLMTLGCTGTTTETNGDGTTNTILSLVLEDSSIAAGFSTTATATITNNWAKDIPVGSSPGTLFLLPSRTDVTFDDAQSVSNIIKDTAQTFYMTINTESTTFPNTYEIYGRLCFHYETEAQQNVVIYEGTKEVLPTNSYTTGPMSVGFGGTPELNIQTQSRMTVLATINNIGNGIPYNTYPSGDMNQLYKITLEVPNDYVQVATDFNSNFVCTTNCFNDGDTRTFIWDSASKDIRLVSDRTQINIPMDRTTLDLVGETERALRMTIEYDYCVDSNKVALGVVRQ